MLIVVLFGLVGVAARNGINEFQRQSNQDHAPPSRSGLNQQPTAQQQNNDSPSADDPDNPYIPIQYRFPGGNPASWRKFMEEEDRKRKVRNSEQRQQDVYFTRLALDREQRIIAHCTSTIAQLEAKIADPAVSEFDKQKLRNYRDFQQGNLEAAQQELAATQRKLNELQNSPT